MISFDLKPIYTAPTAAEARLRYEEFADKWGRAYTAIKKLWERHTSKGRVEFAEGVNGGGNFLWPKLPEPFILQSDIGVVGGHGDDVESKLGLAGSP